MDDTFIAQGSLHDGASLGPGNRQPLVLVIEDDSHLSDVLRPVCECLNIVVEPMPSYDDVSVALRMHRPMAVVAEVDAAGQDGCHVLMTVADHDRSLPVLLISNGDPTLLGAIDAVEEVWQLTSVTKWSKLAGVGGIVDFLFRAGHKGSCMRLLRV